MSQKVYYRSAMRKILFCLTGLFATTLLLAGGCAGHPEGWTSPRELTVSEKAKAAEIAVGSHEASEWLQGRTDYRIGQVDWYAIVWSDGNPSQWWSLESERIENEGVPDFVSKSALWYPGVTIAVGEGTITQMQIAVDLETGKVVMVDGPYPSLSSPDRFRQSSTPTPPPVSTPSVQAPDDILPAPGLGPQYRANIQQQGVENLWPPIQSTEVSIGTSPDTAQITYRDYIETESGQTRNNMFRTYLPGVDPSDASLEAISVILKGVNLPSGIAVTQDDWQWHGPDPARQSKTAVKIEISPQVKPGEYVLSIDVVINGKDYGSVPCTIKVLEP